MIKSIATIAMKVFAMTAGVLAAGYAVLFVAGVLLRNGCGPDAGAELVFVNESGFAITNINIEFRTGGNEPPQLCAANELGADGSLNCRFGTVIDSSFYISGTFENGEKIEANNLGFVAGCASDTHTLIIDHSGVIEVETE